MRYYRQSRLRSSRGHVRMSSTPPWATYGVWVVVAVIALIVIVALVTQVIARDSDGKKTDWHNRTWLEFQWVNGPVNPDGVAGLAKRLSENHIDRVYVEGAAWLSDGSLLYGEYGKEFAEALRQAYPKVQVLLWLRMTGDEIAEAERRDRAVELARVSVRQWGFDGVQLNGFAVVTGSDSYVTLLRALREAIGDEALLSATVPPDRIPADPDVPVGTTVAPELTWEVAYKQRIGLLSLDEVVVMAHASGLSNPVEYETWVAYQVESYADALAELERPPEIVIALPTYDAAPEHDPQVEDVRSAARGVKAGIQRAGKMARLVKGVGLYEYKTTDSLEWQLFAENWLGKR